jgi:UDPglucose--hexose-1-phosphate uridylyltransferase
VGKIEFRKRMVHAPLLDPKENFSRKELTFEVRTDPLTGHHSRILPFRRRLPDTKIPTELVESTRKGCPFCPDGIDTFTPLFVSDLAPEGRIRKGRAVVFPNSFPYARHNWVVALTEDHLLQLDRFSVEILSDAFLAATEGIARAEKAGRGILYSSINCNYLPQAGGGLFHPHFQVVAEEEPSAKQAAAIEGIRRYQEATGAFFWEDLLDEEKRMGERYIGNFGDVHFGASFSPLGILGEILILFINRRTIQDILPEDWNAFSEGLTRIFRYLIESKVVSFNFSIYSGSPEDLPSWVYARLCPRTLMPPWNTNDINYFEKLHDEVICVLSPEDLCKEVRPYFG